MNQISAKHISTAFVLIVWSSMAYAQQSSGQVPVDVFLVKSADYTVTARLPGRIKASTEADVRPQVSGIIRDRLFEEGARVIAGQPLYKIDDETYAASVVSAEAAVAEAQANYDLAIIEARRAEELFKAKIGSASTRDTAIATKARMEAVLKSAEAQLATTRIDLDRTTIKASITGAIGLSQTTTGALVAAQQTTALTTIRSLDPVYVDVTQSASELMQRSFPDRPADNGASLKNATMILPDGTTYEAKGDLLAAEPKVEPTTGMVTLRVSFENPDYQLLPGLYVEVELPQRTIPNAVVVPQNAIMRKADGTAFAWVVESGKVVERTVKIAASTANSWVTSGGLSTGDEVITSGFQKINPGSEVTVKPDAQAKHEGN